MSEKTPLELVQQTYMAFGTGDIPTMFAGMADDIEWNSHYPATVPIAGLWRGHDGVLKLLTAIGENFDVHQFQIAEFLAQGNKVVVLGFEEATVKPTGRSYRNEWVHVWTVQDGKAVAIRTYNDTAAVTAAFA